MQVEVIGSGTMPLTKERVASSFLIKSGSTKILLDAGHGALARLAQRGIDPRSIDAVGITHFHTDHASDAFALIHSRWVYDSYEKGEHVPLLFVGPEGTEERFKAWRKIFWPEPNESYPVTFKEAPGQLDIGNLKLETFPVNHVKWFSSVGFRVRGGKLVVYPGDIGSRHDFNDLVENSRDADLLIIETGYPQPTPNHFTLEQIDELVQKAGIAKTLLVHIKPMPEEEKRIREFVEANQNYLLATDGQTVKL